MRILDEVGHMRAQKRLFQIPEPDGYTPDYVDAEHHHGKTLECRYNQ